MANNLEIIRARRMAQEQEIRTSRREEISAAELPMYYAGDIKFYGVEELMAELGWSRHAVQRLFADQEFPACKKFGKRMVVESHALIRYFSVRRCDDEEVS